MPANGSKNHQVEYQECIDELHEIYLKYEHSHDIIIGGDINEDLNKYKPNSLSNFSHFIFPFGFGVFKLSSLLYSHLKDMLIG
jgi:hypothetical protein